MLNALQFFLIPLALIATAGALGLGIYSLAKGGDFARDHSNRLMRLRVIFQAIAVALLVVLWWLLTRDA